MGSDLTSASGGALTETRSLGSADPAAAPVPALDAVDKAANLEDQLDAPVGHAKHADDISASAVANAPALSLHTQPTAIPHLEGVRVAMNNIVYRDDGTFPILVPLRFAAFDVGSGCVLQVWL